jgi:hypothetical protein
MTHPPSPPGRQGILSDWRTLIAEQKTSFNNYLLILLNTRAALEKGDDEKLDVYREHEAACREKIVSTAAALRTLEGLVQAGPAEQALIEAEKNSLERLRQDALAANALTRELMTVTMGKVAGELAALGESLRKIEGGKTQNHDDPSFIDVYS